MRFVTCEGTRDFGDPFIRHWRRAQAKDWYQDILPLTQKTAARQTARGDARNLWAVSRRRHPLITSGSSMTLPALNSSPPGTTLSEEQ